MSNLFRRSSADPPALFPTYLLPSLSFRRTSVHKKRHDSSDSTSSSSTVASDTSNTSTSTTATSFMSQSSHSHSHSHSNSTYTYDKFSTTHHVPSDPGTGTPSSNPFSLRSSTSTPCPLPTTPLTAPTDKFLHGHTSHIQCSKCATDLALTSQIISKGFTGRHGRAYLVSGHPSSKYAATKRTIGSKPGGSSSSSSSNNSSSRGESTLPNTFLAKPVTRSLVTGQHVVADISCAICGTVIGWKYVEASEEAQKYKVGKFILETKMVRVATRWDNEVGVGFGDGASCWKGNEDLALAVEHHRRLGDAHADEDDDIEFDSQDEDECEDLFAGVWSPGLARRRRQRKSERYRRKAAKVYVPSAPTRGSQESFEF